MKENTIRLETARSFAIILDAAKDPTDGKPRRTKQQKKMDLEAAKRAKKKQRKKDLRIGKIMAVLSADATAFSSVSAAKRARKKARKVLEKIAPQEGKD